MSDAIEELEAEVAARESRVAGVGTGLNSYFVWSEGHAGRRAPCSVVYLHGFSAAPIETRPLPERVAGALGAHLYAPRLSGHGLSGAELAATRAEQWFDDALDAYEVATRLGEQVILLGCSTGASLALWLAAEHAGGELAAMVLLSPNFRPRNPVSRLLTIPGGALLARMIFGAERVSEPESDAVEHAWTCRYPPAALVEMMRVVDRVRGIDLGALDTPTFMIYSPEDKVVSPDHIVDRFERLGSSNKRILPYSESTHANQHVLAGELASPESTEPLALQIIDFLEDVSG